jgi:hypothetical protein
VEVLLVGVSGKRIFWMLLACNFGGVVAGMIIQLPVWAVFGVPTV